MANNNNKKSEYLRCKKEKPMRSEDNGKKEIEIELWMCQREGDGAKKVMSYFTLNRHLKLHLYLSQQHLQSTFDVLSIYKMRNGSC